MRQRILFKDYILYEDGRIYSNKVNRFLKPICEKFGIGKTCFNRVINYISYTDILPHNKK